MSKKFFVGFLAAAVLGATLVVAGPASAESCATLPSTTGATIEIAGQKVRVPSTSGVAVCVEPGGLPGFPRVDSGNGVVSIVVGSGSSTSGYVAVRYTLDGAPNEQRVPIPGTGNSGEICAASVGEPARADCLVKVSIDDIPDIPPVPTVPPIPTLPPIPTVPPLPTVSPEPLPTVPPVETPPPDEFCLTPSVCVLYGGSIVQEPYDAVREFVRNLDDEIYEFLREQCIDPENIFVTCA